MRELATCPEGAREMFQGKSELTAPSGSIGLDARHRHAPSWWFAIASSCL